MPKKQVNSTNSATSRSLHELESEIMEQISSGKVKMKPKWMFIFGSVLLGLGLLGSSIGTIFLLNVSFFLFRQHGPMGEYRLQAMLTSFPWWVPALAGVSLVGSVLLLRRYEFSYKKNFLAIALLFVVMLAAAAATIDATGINDTWVRGRFFKQQLLLNGEAQDLEAFGQGGLRQQRKWQE